jgi:hypothetical protein
MPLKTLRYAGPLVVASALAVTVSGYQARAIGMTDSDAQDLIHQSVFQGFPVAAARASLKAVPAARRAELVRAAGALARTYLASDMFRRRYAADLASAPDEQRPPAPPQKFADFEGASRAAVEENIAELKKETSIPADQRAELEDAMRVQLRQITGANAQQRAAWEAEDRERFARESAAHDEAVAEGRALPVEPKDLIRTRLLRFLSDTADVDFDAPLVLEQGTQKFVDRAHETKPGLWKACYRAGRPATEAARAFANAWLKELGR